MTAYKTYCQTFQVLLTAHCRTFWEGVRVLDTRYTSPWLECCTLSLNGWTSGSHQSHL